MSILLLQTYLLTRHWQIDRHNTYRKVEGFYFPHFEKLVIPIRSTLLDGELVLDVDPVTKTVS